MKAWLLRVEAHVLSVFTSVPFLYGIVVGLGCLISGLASDAAIMPGARQPNAAVVSVAQELPADGAQLVGAIPLPDGGFLVVGRESGNLFVMRLDGAGEPDTTFAPGGRKWLGEGNRAPAVLNAIQ